MKEREDLVAHVVSAEWRLFQSVPSIGGKASCQEDSRTFRIMRSSQMASWSVATLESYLLDLKSAEVAGRNLLTEKYARMMKATSPVEYLRLEGMLLPVDSRAVELIDMIASIVLEWEIELLNKYPKVMKRGRPILSAQDRFGVTSLETYFRGELATYSVRTLELYLANVMEQKARGINGSEITLVSTAKQYGLDLQQKTNELVNEQL